MPNCFFERHRYSLVSVFSHLSIETGNALLFYNPDFFKANKTTFSTVKQYATNYKRDYNFSFDASLSRFE